MKQCEVNLLTVQEESHPTRVRGLKLAKAVGPAERLEVAPHAGAWIETGASSEPFEFVESHPTRVRGLKHLDVMVV